MKTRHRRNRKNTKKGGNNDLIAVQKDGMALQHVKDKTYEIVLSAVKQNGNALQFAPDALKDDLGIVDHAIRENIRAFKYSSPRFKNNPHLVAKIVTMSPYLLQYASPELRDNKEIVRRALNIVGDSLVYASPRLQVDEELLLLSLQRPFGTLERAPIELRDNKEFMLKCVDASPRSLEFASPRLKKDKELVMAAVSIQGATLEYASEELRYDPDVTDAAIAQDAKSIQFALSLPHKPELTRRYSYGYTYQGAEPVCGYHAFSKVILKNVFELLRPFDVTEVYKEQNCNSYLNTSHTNWSHLTPEKCSTDGYLKILLFLHLYYLYKSNNPYGSMVCGTEDSIYTELFTIKIPNLPLQHHTVLEKELADIKTKYEELNITLHVLRFLPTLERIKDLTENGLYIMLFIEFSPEKPGHFVVIVGTDGNEILYKDSYGLEQVYRFIFGKRFLWNSNYYHAKLCSLVIPTQSTELTPMQAIENYRHLKRTLSIDGS